MNAGGGTVARLGAEAVRERLAGAFARAGAEAEIVLVPGAELREAVLQAAEAVREGRLDAVVVGGGDGSVNTAAGVLAGTGVPLGVLPLGTLNHFAKDVGVPSGLEEAAAAIAIAAPRAVDVAECNGRVFVNNSLLGAYPYMVADRERRRRAHGLGKWPAMTLAFLRMLWRFPRRRLELHVEGSATRYRTPALYVGNNEYRIERLTWHRPDGLEDGRLWLMVAKHQGRLGFLWFAFRAAFGGLDRAQNFEVIRAEAAEIRARASRVPVSFDGEIERLRGPLRYRIRPGALLVLAPGRPEGVRDRT